MPSSSSSYSSSFSHSQVYEEMNGKPVQEIQRYTFKQNNYTIIVDIWNVDEVTERKKLYQYRLQKLKNGQVVSTYSPKQTITKREIQTLLKNVSLHSVQKLIGT